MPHVLVDNEDTLLGFCWLSLTSDRLLVGLFSVRRKRRKTDSFASRVPCLRWAGPALTLAGVVFVVGYVLSGKFRFSAFDEYGLTAASPVTLSDPNQRPVDSIRIATFDISAFGQQKSATRLIADQNVDVLGTLAGIVGQFDLVAIQEITDPTGIAIRRLVDVINQSGGSYTATVSDSVGSPAESYAFVWDQTRIRMIQNSAYLVDDHQDLMTREPMVATFETRAPTSPAQKPFRFTLINARVAPPVLSAQSIAAEINVLDDVFNSVRQYEWNKSDEEDYILIGNLNVGVDGLQQIAAIPNVISVAGNLTSNTLRTITLDHILLDEQMTREYTGNSGVLDFHTHLGLTTEQALLISEHLPIWAEFSAYETPVVAPMASSTARRIY